MASRVSAIIEELGLSELVRRQRTEQHKLLEPFPPSEPDTSESEEQAEGFRNLHSQTRQVLVESEVSGEQSETTGDLKDREKWVKPEKDEQSDEQVSIGAGVQGEGFGDQSKWSPSLKSKEPTEESQEIYKQRMRNRNSHPLTSQPTERETTDSSSLFSADESTEAHRQIHLDKHQYNVPYRPDSHVGMSLLAHDNSHMGTSLLARDNTSLLTHVTEYGAVSQQSPHKTAAGRQHLTAGSGKHKKDAVVVAGDRRNEFFTLKRYIFLTLGMPGTPDITTRMQRISTCLAVPFYILLFMWGIAIFVIALQSDGWIWNNHCPPIIPAKAMTMLAGTFYILLGLYWLLILWWSRGRSDPLPIQHRNFTSMALLWWTLCMYFIGVAAALGTEVYEKSGLIVTLGNATSEDYHSMTAPCVGWGPDGDYYEHYIEVPNNMVPLWALCSMGAFWLVYVSVFVIATVSIYSE